MFCVIWLVIIQLYSFDKKKHGFQPCSGNSYNMYYVKWGVNWWKILVFNKRFYVKGGFNRQVLLWDFNLSNF
jgi:hypothetical protein